MLVRWEKHAGSKLTQPRVLAFIIHSWLIWSSFCEIKMYVATNVSSKSIWLFFWNTCNVGPSFPRQLWSFSQPHPKQGHKIKLWESSCMLSLKSIFVELVYLSCSWIGHRDCPNGPNLWKSCICFQSWLLTWHVMKLGWFFFSHFRAWRMNQSGLKIFLRCTLHVCVTSNSSQAWTSSERPVAATQKSSP